MKLSKILLWGIAGAAVVVVARRLAAVEKSMMHDDELDFDAHFIPGSRKLNLDLPDHIDKSWFRTRRYAEDTDALFI